MLVFKYYSCWGLLLLVLIMGSCKAGEEGKITITGGESLHWSPATYNAGFAPRRVSAITSHDNRMWVMGGVDNFNVPLNDVWYSWDGTTWTQVVSGPFFTPRFHHKVVSFGGNLYVIGGKDGSADINRLNDVWYSSDNGESWYDIGNTYASLGREGHQVLVFDNKIWIIGGTDTANVPQKDVKWSTDGATWNSEPDLPLTARDHAIAFVYNNQMWYAGGYDASTDTQYLDSWYTNDGVTWMQGPNHPPDLKGTITVFRNELYSIGGTGGPGLYFNEVWKAFSIDKWKRLNNAEFSPREAYTLVFQDKIWVIGGETFNNPNYVGLIDVWHTN